jgi:diadenosine tetraphosphate (Ap4A) HIT family hydrolase
VADWSEDRVGSAHRGENPMVMARMRSGFAVIGDTQHLPGYSLLLCEDASVNHLTDLDRHRRVEFLLDLSLIGEAVALACRKKGLRRVNYEVLGNSMAWLHGHVHARYDWEPPERVGRPVGAIRCSSAAIRPTPTATARMDSSGLPSRRRSTG